MDVERATNIRIAVLANNPSHVCRGPAAKWPTTDGCERIRSYPLMGVIQTSPGGFASFDVVDPPCWGVVG